MAKDREPFTFQQVVGWWIASPILVWLLSLIPRSWNPIDWIDALIKPLPAWIEIPLGLLIFLVLAVPTVVVVGAVFLIFFMPVLAVVFFDIETAEETTERARQLKALAVAVGIAIVIANVVIIVRSN